MAASFLAQAGDPVAGSANLATYIGTTDDDDFGASEASQ